MADVVKLLAQDVCSGLKDCLSGWWVALKIWRSEAKGQRSSRAQGSSRSQGSADLVQKRLEARGIRVDKSDGTLAGVIVNTVATAVVALGITFCIQSACLYVSGFLGPSPAVWAATWLLQCLWWLPSLVLIKLTSLLNNNAVADKVFLHKFGPPSPALSLGENVSELVFSTLYQTIFIIQASLLQLFLPWPWLAFALDKILLSLFYSLYAFEYKWTLLGVPGHQRVAHVENCWPYFLAFGLPAHLAIDLWDSLYTRAMAFTLTFPFIILGATAATPARNTSIFPLRVVTPSVEAANILHRTIKGWASKQTPNTPSSSSVR